MRAVRNVRLGAKPTAQATAEAAAEAEAEAKAQRAAIFTTVNSANVQTKFGTLALINTDIGEIYQGRIERAYERTRINGNLGDIMDNPLLKDFFTLYSSADGYNCLVHSILTIGCENFRGLSQTDKDMVAENFRHHVIPRTPQYIAKINTADEIQARKIWRYIYAVGLPPVGGNITEVDIDRIKDIRNNLAGRHADRDRGELPDYNTEYRVGTRQVFLDSGDLSRLCAFLGITVKLFNLRDRLIEGSNEPLNGQAALPIYMIYNNGSHYEGVIKCLYLGEYINWGELYESQLVMRAEMLERAPAPVAQAPLKAGEWACPTCTLVNTAGATKCSVCNTAKPAASASPLNLANSGRSVALHPLEVPAASASPLNLAKPRRRVELPPLKVPAASASPLNLVKSGSLAPPPLKVPAASASPLNPVNLGRRVALPLEVPATGSWNCNVCTFLNQASAKECQMCGTKKADPSPLGVASPVLPPLRGNPRRKMSYDEFKALLNSPGNPFLGGRRSRKQRTRRRKRTVRYRR